MMRHRASFGLVLFGLIVATAPLLACISWLWMRWSELDSRNPGLADLVRAVVFVLPVVGLAGGLLLAGLAIYNRIRWTAVQADKVIALTYAQQSKGLPASITSLTLHDSSRPQITTPHTLEPPPQLAGPMLPGPVDLAQIDHHPSKERILLAMGPDGPITVSVANLCHVALLGATGGGKSNLLRLLLPQLQAVGARVALADPHYAPIDPENGDDWRLIEQRLFLPPAIKAKQIKELLAYFTEELARRLERRNQGQSVGVPLFFAFDELPVIADQVPGAIDALGRLLREGRKVHLLTIGASQSMLVKEVGGSSALRDQYRTAAYVGGDKKSASAILDMPERAIDDSPLGKGVVLLRTQGQPTQLVRVPLASNEAIAGLLCQTAELQILDKSVAGNRGSFGFQPAPKSEPQNPTRNPSETQKSREESAKPQTCDAARSARILALFRDGKSVAEIVKDLEGPIKGPKYNQVRDEVETVLRKAVFSC